MAVQIDHPFVQHKLALIRDIETGHKRFRELAKETQCIVITHNKLTMEVAASLYGVTMEERGVSKLIQVELEEVHPEMATA